MKSYANHPSELFGNAVYIKATEEAPLPIQESVCFVPRFFGRISGYGGAL